MTTKSDNVAKDEYVAPKLTIYGNMVDLTAAGSTREPEVAGMAMAPLMRS